MEGERIHAGAQRSPQKRAQRVGYDLDGVICTDPTDRLVGMFDTPMLGILAVRWHHHRAALLHTPLPGAWIITGRLECDRESTRAWLHRRRIYNPVLMNPWTPERGTDWKALCIATMGIGHYVESDQRVADELRERLPYCTVTTPREELP